MITYDDLQPAHFAEWGMTFKGDPSRLLGFACRKDGSLIAIGLVWVDADDRWVAGFRGRPGFPAGIHRKAVELFEALDAAGVAEIWAEADVTIPRARAWLERLGFERADPVKEVYKRVIRRGYLSGIRSLRVGQGEQEEGRTGAGSGELRGSAA